MPGARLERGERVDLEEVDRAVVAEAEVDPPEVADPEHAVDASRRAPGSARPGSRFTLAGARTETYRSSLVLSS